MVFMLKKALYDELENISANTIFVIDSRHRSTMSSLEENQFYRQLWNTTTGPTIRVVHLYFEVKVLNNTEFESFLNDPNNMHNLFHYFAPKVLCCKCSTVSLAAPNKNGHLNLRQFDILYDNCNAPQPNHGQHCLCKYSAKSAISVDKLDITLFYIIVKQCCPSRMNLLWLQNIKDVRNFLAHVGESQVKKQDFEDHWKTLSIATLGFAEEIGQTCKTMFNECLLGIQSLYNTNEANDSLTKV